MWKRLIAERSSSAANKLRTAQASVTLTPGVEEAPDGRPYGVAEELSRACGRSRLAVGVVAFGAAQASASSAPIVIPYAKTCSAGHCLGTAGDGGTFEMRITSFVATGKAAKLTMTEWITVGDIWFTAEMKGNVSPAGFIVLNGTVTEGSFAGAQVHQRSNLVGTAGTTTSWTGEVRLMPESA